MFGRSAGLTATSLLALALVPTLAGNAQAHRLDAEAKVRPDRTVQIEAWFDLTGDPAQHAHVQVSRLDGHLVTEGRTSERGVFVFTPPPDAETLRAVISAGQGHVKELTLLLTGLEGSSSAGTDAIVPHPVEFPVKDVLIGLGLLTAIAALALSMRNARQLRELARKDRI
jgi:hypothetical protein